MSFEVVTIREAADRIWRQREEPTFRQREAERRDMSPVDVDVTRELHHVLPKIADAIRKAIIAGEIPQQGVGDPKDPYSHPVDMGDVEQWVGERSLKELSGP